MKKGTQPKKQSSPKKKAQGSKKSQNGGRKRTSNGYTAPSAVSGFQRQSHSFTGSGVENGGLVMRSCAAMYEVGTGVVADNFDALRGSSGLFSSNAQLSLTAPSGFNATAGQFGQGFISPAWDLIASAFTLYRVRKLKFVYMPQATTIVSDRLIFGFAADPIHPLVGGAGPATLQGLESLSDSVPFAPWSPWELDVTKSIRKERWLDTFSTTVGSTGTGNQSAQALRTADFGSVGCVGSVTGSVAAALVYGIIYMEIEVEFSEFCPISITRPALYQCLGPKLLSRAKELSKGDDVLVTRKYSDDIDVSDLSPLSPRFPVQKSTGSKPLKCYFYKSEWDKLKERDQKYALKTFRVRFEDETPSPVSQDTSRDGPHLLTVPVLSTEQNFGFSSSKPHHVIAPRGMIDDFKEYLKVRETPEYLPGQSGE